MNQVTRALIDTAGRTGPKNDPSKYLGYGAVRPRVVLANPQYNPGPANVDPLAKENGGDLLTKSVASSTSSSSSPSAPSCSASTPSQASAKGSTGGTSAAGSSAESSNDKTTLKVVLGTVAAVVVIGGGGRGRRAGAARQVTSFEWTCRGQYRGVEV
ncbi:hypothetical protein AB0L10_36250 [Streptomyces flaveolus]|uniref:hypothetical protein n=1 Tax=Streptomyces flaveolus TaxID=67297 RepID=UPI003445CFB5